MFPSVLISVALLMTAPSKSSVVELMRQIDDDAMKLDDLAMKLDERMDVLLEKVKKGVEQDEVMIKALIARGRAEDSDFINRMKKTLASTRRTIKELQSMPLSTIRPKSDGR